MKVSAPLVLCLSVAALSCAGFVWQDRLEAERHTITLYSQNGAPIGKWIGKGKVKATPSGCSFTSEDGREMMIGNPYVVERQR